MVDGTLKDDRPTAIMPPFHGANRTWFQRFWTRGFVPIFVLSGLIFGILFGIYGPYIPRLFGIPIVVIAALIIWALPDFKVAPTRTVTALFFAFPMALLLWPNYLAIALPGLPWLTLLRLVGVPMALLFMVSISVSARFRSELWRVINAEPLIWKLIIAFAVDQLATVVFSSNLFSSLQKALIYEMNWTVMFFVACYVFRKPGRATLWAQMFCLTLIPLGLIGLYERAESKLPWVGHIPHFLKINDEAVMRTLAGGFRSDAYRIEATFTTALGFGEYGALVIPFLLYFMAGPFKAWIRIACGLAIPFVFLLVIWTDSRLGLIGGLIGVVMFGLMKAVAHWRVNKRSLLAPAFAFAYPAAAALMVLGFLSLRTIQSHVVGSGQYDNSNEARVEMYRKGIPMVATHPWGFGAAQGAKVLGFTDPAGFLTIDTYVMRIALEYGVIGFVAYYGVLAWAACVAGRESMRRDKQGPEDGLYIPLAVTLLVFVVIKTVFSNDDNHPLIYMMLGMIVGLRYQAKLREPASQPRPRQVHRTALRSRRWVSLG